MMYCRPHVPCSHTHRDDTGGGADGSGEAAPAAGPGMHGNSEGGPVGEEAGAGAGGPEDMAIAN
jgi:hypothetical protein